MKLEFTHQQLKKLSFKIGSLIIITELIVLFTLGLFYINRFTAQVNDTLKQKFLTPGYLMSKGALRYESAQDSLIMSNLLGENIEECAIIGTNGKIYFSLTPQYRGKNRDEVSVFDGYNQLKEEIVDPVFFNTSTSKGKFLVAIHPLRLTDGKFIGHLFIFAKADRIAKQKTFIVLMFLIGSLICVFLSSLVIIYLFNTFISNKIKVLLEKVNNLTNGHLSYQENDHLDSSDEIGQLSFAINKLNNKLREIV